MFSHKRKHERRDFENAYRKFREDSNDMDSAHQYRGGILSESQSYTGSPISHMSLPLSIKTEITEDDFRDESFDSRIPMSEQSMEESSSDMKSVKSECSDNKSHDQEESEMMEEDGREVEEEGEEEPVIFSRHAEQLSGEKLNDSLTLPIPVYSKQKEKGQCLFPDTVSITSSPKSETGIIFRPNDYQGFSVASPKVSPSSTSLLLTKPSPGNPQERKERDESWKNYLIRYYIWMQYFYWGS